MTRHTDCAIAIFVKTPGLSPVKTRLAASIGTTNAEKFYSLCIMAIRDTVQSSSCVPFWAVGEEDGLGSIYWKDFNRIYTGPGGLGERQDHVYETLMKTYKKVLLIGADTPQLSAGIINSAITALEQEAFVLGPARDGGYYLFGGQTAVEREVWTSVTYSASETRAELIKNLPTWPFLLPMLSDADTEDDLAHIQQEMPEEATLAQMKVLKWITGLAGERILTAPR